MEVHAERNALAAKVETLEAQLADYSNLKEENEMLRMALCDQNKRDIDSADEAIKSRDDIIEQLSKRLESTLDVLAAERKQQQQQQQQRRQIFPNNLRTSPKPDDSPKRAEDHLSAGPLLRAQEDAHLAKVFLEEMQAAAMLRML